MDLSMQQIGVVGSNAAELSTLLNVEDEKEFLQQIMSPEVFQDCLREGTNIARMQILCQKMIQEIISGSSNMYDSLCAYFLKRSEAYKSMHQRFTAIVSNSNKENSEPVLLQENVKVLNEVTQKQCGQSSNAIVDSESKVQEVLVNTKKPLAICDVKTPSATVSVSEPLPKSRLTPDEKLKFSHRLMSPMESNAAGSYPQFHCNGANWLSQWKRVLREKSRELCWLPPLILSATIVKKAAINLNIERWDKDLCIAGRFHTNVPSRVSHINVALEMSMTFLKKDNTMWTVNRQLIVTVGRGGRRFFLLYDFPFDSLTLAPPVFDISIKGVSLDEKWFHMGLAPRFSADGKFESMDLSTLQGTDDCGREWKKIVEDKFGCGILILPPLVVATQNGEDVAVCVDGRRVGDELVFDAAFHPSMLKKTKSCHMLVKITLHLKTTDNAEVRLHAENRVTVSHKVGEPIVFGDIPWASISSSICPCVDVSIIPGV